MRRIRVYAGAMAVLLAAGLLSLGGARPAHAASEDTYRIATYVLGAGSAYALARGKGTLGLLGAAGTYVAYRKWKDEVNDRHRDRRHRRQHVHRRYGHRR